MNHPTLNVSELNAHIKEVLQAGFPRSVWLCGEISGLGRLKSGRHLYFDLVEKDEKSDTVKAKIPVAIWDGVRQKIELVLKKSENSFELKDGIEVRFLGRVDFYPPYGKVTFVVESIDPVYTLGKLAQERQKLIDELKKSGLLEKNKSLSLPLVPLRIGLITAFDSAAYHDFLHELQENHYSFEIHFKNALVQGKNAVASVCEAMSALQKVDGLDLIVLTRGGGAITDLSIFDAKEIALAIADSKYPVLTGIGHEINTSIADLAAHSFFKTPTATASFLNQQITVFLENLNEKHLKILDRMQELLRQEKITLKNVALRLQTRTQQCLAISKEKTSFLKDRLFFLAENTFQKAHQEVKQQKTFLKQRIDLRFQQSRVKIKSLEKMIRLASPDKILKRGFSITRTQSGKIIRSVEDLKEGDKIVSQLEKGSVLSIIEKKDKTSHQ